MSWSIERVPYDTVFLAEDFDAPAPRPERIALVAPQQFTQEALEAARRAAWEEGLEAGRAAAQQDQHAEVQKILAAIALEVKATREDLPRQGARMAEELAGLLLAAFEKLFPALSASHGAAELAAVAAEILPRLPHDQQIKVLVAPDRVDIMRAVLAEHGDDLAENLRLLPSSKLGASDVIIRWHLGEAVRDVDALWQRILAILAPHGLVPIAVSAVSPQPEHRHVD